MTTTTIATPADYVRAAYDAIGAVDLGSGSVTYGVTNGVAAVTVDLIADADNGEERTLDITRDPAHPDGLGWRTYGDYVGKRHHRTIGDVVDYVAWYACTYGDAVESGEYPGPRRELRSFRLFAGGATVDLTKAPRVSLVKYAAPVPPVAL
ncbi:hypothetical protein QLT00_gp90 [Gordonia phage Commandaria]|uniref:Uncharacterized protein n=1 Tax=Gordonia phage Commandaria TaxID=3038364 RepID=A0AAF0K163_9CAUD|nr:hypothetical protein QLT00_gp90 [Gordonia phage Commandaria]WGH20873.1 hypothetical protein [Gordonia phage Commandaria]